MGYESGRGFLVTVIDDDQSMRESLPDLLRECGYEVEAFSSAEVFLACGDLDRTKCLVLDVAMPGMSGPELHRELHRRGRSTPVVFITAHGDDTMRPRLLEQGAGKPAAFLARGEDLIVAAAGDVLDNTYRVDSMTPTEIVFTYLPLNERQTIALAGGFK